jgi:hypothetical protein
LHDEGDARLLILFGLLHRLRDMARAMKNPPTLTDGQLGRAVPESAAKDPDIEIHLLEIVRALARAAARKDHRKALEAEAMSSSEAGPQ